MADRSLSNEIRRLVDEQVPEAPWLEDRVMAAVWKDAAGRSARTLDGRGPRLVIALAAAIIAVLAVAVLVGTRHAEHPTLAPGSKPSPRPDAAVLGYQALINRDLRLIYLNGPPFSCKSRMQCLATGMAERTATEALLHDVESTTAPTSLVPAAAQLKAAAQQYIAGLDPYVAAMQDPNTNYLAPTEPTAGNLDLAGATVVCWPGVPDLARGDLGPGGYNCIGQPPGK
jgi:hypothetical protein